MTLRPLGPSVTLTALLRISTPRSIRSRASEEKRTYLAATWPTVLEIQQVNTRDLNFSHCLRESSPLSLLTSGLKCDITPFDEEMRSQCQSASEVGPRQRASTRRPGSSTMSTRAASGAS